MNKHLKLLLASIALTAFLSASHANAFQIDACAAYASTAVNQQRQNLQWGCGFQGLRWHQNFSAHKVFCQSVGVQLSVIGNQDRQSDLNRCRAAGGRFGNEIIIVPRG